MKHEDGKIRLLLIERMLRYDRMITSTEILRRLENWGIYANRKTVYSDICAINMVVPVEAKSGKDGGYRLVDVVARCEDGKEDSK